MQRGSKMEFYEVVRSKLIELCGERNISNKQLAQKSGVPLSTINNILYCKSVNPGIVTIKKLCDGVGIPLGDFLSQVEERFDQSNNALTAE